MHHMPHEHYLLGQNAQGDEWVSPYCDAEMAEIFTAEQIAALAEGKTIEIWGKYGCVRWTDMVVAARAAAFAAWPA